MSTSLSQMTAAVPREISQEVDLEFTVSNRIVELMQKHGLTKLELKQKLSKRPIKITKWLSIKDDYAVVRVFR